MNQSTEIVMRIGTGAVRAGKGEGAALFIFKTEIRLRGGITEDVYVCKLYLALGKNLNL